MYHRNWKLLGITLPALLWVLLLALGGLGVAQGTRIYLSQLSATGATAGKAIVYNGTTPVWAYPDVQAVNIISGLVNPARLGTGTADGTTCLRGNQTWGSCGGAASVDQAANYTWTGQQVFKADVILKPNSGIPYIQAQASNGDPQGYISFDATEAKLATTSSSLTVSNNSMIYSSSGAPGFTVDADGVAYNGQAFIGSNGQPPLPFRLGSASAAFSPYISGTQFGVRAGGTDTYLFEFDDSYVSFNPGNALLVGAQPVVLDNDSRLSTCTSSKAGIVPAGGTTSTSLRGDCTWSATVASLRVNGTATTSTPNLNKTTPAAPTGTAPVTWQASGSDISAYVDTGDSNDARRRRPFMDAEFLTTSAGNQSEFLGAAVSAGTNTTAPAAATLSPNHPGVVLARSSTTANSGYQYSTALTTIRLGGGEQVDFIIWLPAAQTGTSLRFGYQDSITATAPVDGMYVDFATASLAPTCTARSNSVQTQSAAIGTLAASTWYHLRVSVASPTSATCTIWNDAGTLIGSQIVTTNIPSASGRELGIVAIGTNSGTTATDLFAIDYMSSAWLNTLTRGK